MSNSNYFEFLPIELLLVIDQYNDISTHYKFSDSLHNRLEIILTENRNNFYRVLFQDTFPELYKEIKFSNNHSDFWEDLYLDMIKIISHESRKTFDKLDILPGILNSIEFP